MAPAANLEFFLWRSINNAIVRESLLLAKGASEIRRALCVSLNACPKSSSLLLSGLTNHPGTTYRSHTKKLVKGGGTMKTLNSYNFSAISRWSSVLAVLIAPQLVQAAATWQATVGAQSHDLGRQALAFLANELWVHVGDSITWTVATDEVHTVTFLPPGQ